MKKLYLGQVPRDFSPSEGAALSQRSFVGREDLYWKCKDSLSFEDPFVLPEIASKTVTIMNRLANEYFLPRLIVQLNEFHGTNYSIRFWSILLKPWLLSLLYTCCVEYAQLSLFVTHNADESFEVDVLSENSAWNFKDTEGLYYEGIYTIEFHHWILSSLLGPIAPRKWVLKYRDRSAIAGEMQENRSNQNTTLKERLKRQCR